MFVLMLFLNFIVCFILKKLSIDNDIVTYFFVTVSFILMFFNIVNLKIDKKIKLILFVALIIRLIFVHVDIYLYRLPNAGSDDDAFYNTSIQIYNNQELFFSDNIYGNYFTKLLAIFYVFIGPNRVAVQSFNSMLSIISAIYLIKAMKNLNINEKKCFWITLIILLMPNSIIMNSILRRETIMELLICLSIYSLTKWIRFKSKKDLIFTILFLFIASLFHTVIIIGIVALFIYLLIINYLDKNKKVNVSTIIGITFIGAISLLFVYYYVTNTGNRFSKFDSMDSIYDSINKTRGGSVYLESYKANSLKDVVIFLPLKLFCFFFSPLPWQWRNAMDAITFMTDSVIYLLLIVRYFYLNKNINSKLFFWIFIVISCVFSLGTFTSGTATRHRFTMLPFLLISYVICEKKKGAKNQNG